MDSIEAGDSDTSAFFSDPTIITIRVSQKQESDKFINPKVCAFANFQF